jgi:hypothetical protein
VLLPLPAGRHAPSFRVGMPATQPTASIQSSGTHTRQASTPLGALVLVGCGRYERRGCGQAPKGRSLRPPRPRAGSCIRLLLKPDSALNTLGLRQR